MRKTSILLFSIILSLVFQSCNLIWICNNTTYRKKTAHKYENQIPIKVEELKTMLYKDTTHYKVVIIYSPCCGACGSHMRTTYRNMLLHSDTTIKFYFIVDDCGGIKYNEIFLQVCGIYPNKMYYFNDTFQINKGNNIVNYLFPSDDKVTGELGVPMSLIISKNNKLKKAMISIDYGEEKRQYLKAMPLYYLPSYDFDKIDFDIIDIEPEINWDICSRNEK